MVQLKQADTLSAGEQALAEQLVEILASKVPPSPPEPIKPSLPAPLIPPKPALPNLNYSPSDRYVKAREANTRELQLVKDGMKAPRGKKQLRERRRQLETLIAHQEKLLLGIQLSEVDPSLASEYRHKEAEVERWKRQCDQARESFRRERTMLLAAYRTERIKWLDRDRIWRQQHELPQRIVRNMRHDLEQAASGCGLGPVVKLWWRLLPPGETSEERVVGILRNFHIRYPQLRVDEARLRFAYGLKPAHVYVGEDEFDGYFACDFADTKKVLLDNPIEGNAAYIFDQDWRKLSRLSKSEILSSQAESVTRVYHIGAWQMRIRHSLRKRSSRRS